MNRNRKGVMPVITRAVYKAVKKYDHQQFTDFCAGIYKSGYEDGRESVPGVDVKAIYDAIAATKGIGPKKLEEIKKNVEAVFAGEKDTKSGSP